MNCWTVVVWIIVMFLSAVWTHSDGTHSLQSIWCNATFLQICSIEETHPHLERPEDEYVLSKCSFESHSAFAQWWETTASSTTHLYFRHTGPVLSGSLSTFAFVHLADAFIPSDTQQRENKSFIIKQPKTLAMAPAWISRVNQKSIKVKLQKDILIEKVPLFMVMNSWMHRMDQ